MRALVMTRYGGEDVVAVRDVPEPAPGDGEVLVNVHAASVNPVDMKIHKGQFKPLMSLRMPAILGEDISGTVAKVGSAVTGFHEGDEVFACLSVKKMGAFAERAVVPASDLAHKPKRLSHEEAACIPLSSLTACQAYERAHLTSGQRVFIRAGSGGTGVVAIQIAKLLGAHVTTTTSTKNVEWVRALGADEVLDYTKDACVDVVSGCDVALETSAGDALLDSFRVVARGGHVVSIGDMPDAAFAKEWGLGVMMQWAFAFIARKATREAKRSGVSYIFFIMHPDGEKLSEIAGWVDDGKLTPKVDKTFPLANAHNALAHVSAGRTKGKVIITMR